MSNGYIKLYRQLQDCDIWDDPEPFDKRSAWIDLLMMVNRQDKEVYINGHMETVHAGQKITSIRKLAERWHWSKDKVVRYTDELKSRQMILKESDSTRTLITIVNWAKYQIGETESATDAGQFPIQKCDTSKSQTRSKEVEKKEKGVSNDTPKKKTQTSIVESSELPEATKAKLIEWLRYKTEKRQGYKETGLNALIRQLSRFVAEFGVDAVNDRIDQAMSNGWIGMNLDKIQGARSSPTRAAPEPSYDDEQQRLAAENLERLIAEGSFRI